jgi:hypothetical protein
MQRAFALPLFLLALSTAGCTASTGSAPEALPPRQRVDPAPSSDPMVSAIRARRNSDHLSPEEIQATRVSTAYEVVQRLRPLWLRQRGGVERDPDGTTSIIVRYNGRTMGPPTVLRDIDAGAVISMQWIDPITARSTFGAGHGRGVIVITGR